MPNTALKVEHLSKMYRLGVINNGTLWQDIQTFFAIKFGKEDPHSKIGEDKYSGDKDHFWALKDISFEVKQGDRLGIIGKNGAGKSTLLKILSRITTPTEGTIKINGKIASLLEVGTGFHGELTGRENIFLNGAILGMKRRRIAEKLDSIIDFSGIEQHIDTPVKRYSSGMYVRLAFAVAAHLDSDILIADEVLAVGDAEFQEKAIGKMQELSTGEGRTVFFVSHNMLSVGKLCNNGILLHKGNITYSGNINDCINNYIGKTDIKIDDMPVKILDIDSSKPFQVEKIELLNNENEQTLIFERTDNITILLHCISYTPISDMYGYLRIKNSNDLPIIICDSREDGNDIFNSMSSEKYLISLTIPSCILASGEYTIDIIFGSGYYKDFYIDSHEKCFKFKIIDSLSLRGNERNSLTSMILDWKIN